VRAFSGLSCMQSLRMPRRSMSDHPSWCSLCVARSPCLPPNSRLQVGRSAPTALHAPTPRPGRGNPLIRYQLICALLLASGLRFRSGSHGWRPVATNADDAGPLENDVLVREEVEYVGEETSGHHRGRAAAVLQEGEIATG
jgi:hypothetical protein